jgi:hypothetical protein
VVVGVTNEPKSLVAKTVEKNRMKFPVAMVKSPEEANYGIRGFPSAYLLDVDGTILWKGHPGSFEGQYGRSRLERDLKRTSVVPPAPEGREKMLGKSIAAGDFAGAYRAATQGLVKHPEDKGLKEFARAIEKTVEARVREASVAEEGGEYAKALAIYSALAKRFKGVPGAEDAAVIAKEIGKNKEAAADLAAAKKWDSAMTSWRKGDFDKALKSVKSIAHKYEETATGERAMDMLSRHGS